MITILIFAFAFVILVSATLEYFPKFRNEVWALKLKMFVDYAVNPIRKNLPHDIPFDAAPWLAITILIILNALFKVLIYLYTLLIIADTILSYFPHTRNEIWAQYIKRFADYSLNPIRKFLPPDLPFDFSPIIIIILLQVLVLLH
jgi:YggT family protein